MQRVADNVGRASGVTGKNDGGFFARKFHQHLEIFCKEDANVGEQRVEMVVGGIGFFDHLHFDREVWFAADDLSNAKPLAPYCGNEIPAERQRLNVDDLCHGSDVVRRYVGIAGFRSLRNERDAETFTAFQAFVYHLLVTRLEDMQIESRARKKHGVEWKEAQAAAHRACWLREGRDEFPAKECSQMFDLLRYLETAHPTPHPLLLELEQHGGKEGIPIISRETGRFLSVLVRMMQANRILEIGTAFGYSTLWMALAQPPAGKIWTIDPDYERTEVALSYFRRAGEDDYITVFNQDAAELLPTFPQRNLDIVFIDADRERYREYLDLTVPMLKRSGIVVVDDCLLNGRIVNQSPEQDDRDVGIMRAFNERFLTHPDLDATILPLGDGTGIGVRTT